MRSTITLALSWAGAVALLAGACVLMGVALKAAYIGFNFGWGLL